MTQITATFSEEVVPSSISLVLRNPAGNPVPAKLTYEIYGPARTVTLDPNFNLAPATTYTALRQPC